MSRAAWLWIHLSTGLLLMFGMALAEKAINADLDFFVGWFSGMLFWNCKQGWSDHEVEP